jgi:hypothetical protein
MAESVTQIGNRTEGQDPLADSALSGMKEEGLSLPC